MKRGAAEDPLAEETTQAGEDGSAAESESDRDSGAHDDAEARSTETGPETEPSPDGSGPAARTTSQSIDALPYLPRRQLRGQSVKADRDSVQFFLRNEVQVDEKSLQRAVEDELGKDVNKTDLREAAYVFAQQHPEGVAAILREWGIEHIE